MDNKAREKNKFIVCEETIDEGTHYTVLTIFPGEMYIQQRMVVKIWRKGQVTSSITIIRRNDTTVNTAGKFCGEYSDIRGARIAASRLQRVHEVMES